VIPAAFDYVRAESADHAVALIGEHGDDAKFLAGGMSLLPLMKLRLATPAVLVDLGRVRDLSYIRDDGNRLAIGALTRHRDLEISDVLAKDCGVLRAVAAQVGDNQVRHRGTIGGSVVHGDPASDIPAALLALDATFVAKGPNGERRIAATDFFQGFLETALGEDELLTEIQVRKTGANGFNFQKFNRRAQDWAIVGAVAARVNGGTHVALVNMGATVLRAHAVETALSQGADPATASREAAAGTEPPSDLNASPEYRAHLAQVLVQRALEAL
jgi:carbon-monoxide dehydrogenase medium subunit